MDGVVVMGRKTWESLPEKPLLGRVNIVLTSDKNFSADGAIIAHSIQEVINICESTNRECYIIGGASLYSSFIQLDLIESRIMLIFQLLEMIGIFSTRVIFNMMIKLI